MLFQLYFASKIFVTRIWPLWENHKYLFNTFLTGICSKLVRFPVGPVFSKISVLLHCTVETFSEWHPSPCSYIFCSNDALHVSFYIEWRSGYPCHETFEIHAICTMKEHTVERSPCCASFSWWHASLSGRLTVLALNQDLFCCWIMTLCSTLDIWLA